MLFLLTGAYPLWLAWKANRRTTLLTAVNWTIGAWATWAAALLQDAWPLADPGPTNYLALCLTGSAAVAVLGARRPGVGPWNFVIIGLLAVLLLPLAESLLLGRGLDLGAPRTIFLAGTLAVGVLNYLPTRLALTAVLLGVASVGEMLDLPGQAGWIAPVGRLCLALAPWTAYASFRRQEQPASEFDLLWLDFRDRFGLVWGQRLREQFNRAAMNAGWPVQLRWRGLHLLPGVTPPDRDTQEVIVAALRALLKRFSWDE